MNKQMKNTLMSLMLSLLILPWNVSAQQKVTDYVNPMIGTGAIDGGLSGNNYPGATTPFGLVQLSPDTHDAPDWDAASGYNYTNQHIYGFSHTHLSGTGVAELCDILLQPGVERSSFSHEDESARAGYYQVRLSDKNINVELTATTHTGFHKYTFPANAEKKVLIDLDHGRKKGDWGTRVEIAQIRIIDPYTIEGYRYITGWAPLRKVCFYAKFNQPIVHSILKNGGAEYENTPVVNGNNLRAVLSFDKNNAEPVLVKVGLSTVSPENAKQNLTAELPDWNFNRAVAQADAEWNAELSKIQIEGTDTQKKIFYTSLYHTYIQPNILSDVNAKDAVYSTFSLWDTYRAAHPLYTLLQPKRNADFVNSMIAHYQSYGYLPIWHLWGQENYCMIGNHAIPVVVDAVLKNTPGIDVNLAYEAVKNSSLISHTNSPFEVWEKYGYMPENIQTQSVSITLEMAFDDWCVAQLAQKLGKTDDYNRFIARSAYYKNLYNPQTHFFQSKDDKGNWIEPFDPFKYGANGGNPFTEGNAWQYYWYVPQNIPDLIALTGGNKAFVAKLDEFFSNEYHVELNGNISGLIGQYAHGNEPSHHVAYLYNYAGQPQKTQKYVAQILTELYNTSFSGYAGNDDCGEMSAWYVFSAMGIYPVNPTSGRYDFGTPLLDKSEIQLPNGKTFTILAPKKSPQEIYIQSVKLNGKPYTKQYITHEDILAGGTLEFKMKK
ncbi:MAG: hypothetical protein EZS26_002607 [Candidatus Ordinivivax streblomastigis]|uniref:Glycoside hydrolase family 92 protein n=1 Tax=Candidatus Ordinivivax streblomastigis TaxID=2540710 RepID=A0A5M8NXH7_9BACT|nr:MAG: hypothetical protein EZS26_002607 [Candidatus Ordinivivax streblomastigis]